MITSAQCRAGRALLEWSQDQLATNAQVSRATIVDFERGARVPGRNNLASIEAALHAAGVHFVGDDEQAGLGAGARFRKVWLEYSRDVRVSSDGVTFNLVYLSHRYVCDVPRDILEDLEKANWSLAERDEQFRLAAQRHQHEIIDAAERRLVAGVDGDRFELRHADFDDNLFR